jgi:uncharacterized phage infection (PIP) family protein YhgE
MQGTTPETPEVPSSMTEEQAASALLERMGVREEPPAEAEEPEEPETEQAEEATQETEESDEPEAEESEEVEIDVAGEKFKVPAALKEQAERIQAKAKEVEAGATRKFQEAADQRKLAETQIEQAKQIGQLSQAEVEHLADLRTIDRRLQQLASMDINAIAESDPAMLARLTAESQQLQLHRGRIVNELQQTQATKHQATAKESAEKVARLQAWAEKNIKGWSTEYDNALMDFGVKQLGADPKTLLDIVLKGGEPMLRALDLAYKGWKVHTTDPKAKQVVATKTLKPGATGQAKTNAQQTAQKAVNRLRQTGSVDDAAAAILARMNAKRR